MRVNDNLTSSSHILISNICQQYIESFDSQRRWQRRSESEHRFDAMSVWRLAPH
jgi:hypothetical protein